MVFAVIPWGVQFENNELFKKDSPLNRDGLSNSFIEMKEYLKERGSDINTIDMYEDLTAVDYFLFFDWKPDRIVKLSKMGLSDRLVYCNGEPPTVNPLNTPEGYEYVKKFFPYIMTWNKELVDNRRVFFRAIQYHFAEHADDVPCEKKKLLTSISANKKSDYKDELYTERERLITFFENAIPDQFDMYGTGWEGSGHPSYKGSPKSKFDTYTNYKFALALENTRNVKGYVTEKIFDCLTGHIVPVYYGADDILDYVSKDCFIDYRDFDSPESLLKYMENMSRQEYDAYLEAAKKVVGSKEVREFFSGTHYTKDILFLTENAWMQGFKCDDADLKKLSLSVMKQNAVSKVKGLKKIVKRK